MHLKPVHIVYLVLFLSIGTQSFSQTLQWVRNVGGAQWEEGRNIAVDGSGNVYVAGIFPGTADFDPGTAVLNLTASGGQDIFITKYDAAGNLIWVKQIGNAGWEDCYGLAVDANNNIYITGSFLGTTDFDPGPSTFNLSTADDIEAFICKLNSAGNFIWAKKWGGTQAVAAHAIALDHHGNIYTTGYFDGTAEFDPGPGICYLAATGYSDIFVNKFDSTGNFVWAKKMGGPAGEGGYSIAIDNNNNVYTTGTFWGTVDFDPGTGVFNLMSPGAQEIYISKLDSLGNFVWAKQMGGETGYCITTDNNGNVYSSGYFGWDDIIITKLNSSGNILWDKTIGAFVSYAIDVDDDFNVYTTGQFYGTEDFDPGFGTYNLTAIGSSDSYINKLDSSGNFVWVKQLGGTNEVQSRGLVLDEINNIYTTGFFDQTADFNPAATTFNLTASGSYDVFIHKMALGDVGVLENSFENAFRVYPNPTQGSLTIEFKKMRNNVTFILRNMIGQVIDTRFLKNGYRAEIQIDASNGMYLLEAIDEYGQKTVCRIVKE